MSTERQQDAGMDRLLRAALEPDHPVNAGVCPGADAVAAYAEGALTARERADIEPHLASCERCQAVLAVLAREAVADTGGGPAPAVPAWRTWLSVPRLRWLVPAGAAAIALVLYVAVGPEPGMPGRPEGGSPAAVPSPEFTVAQRSEQTARTVDELASSDKRQPDRVQRSTQALPQAPEAFQEAPGRDRQTAAATAEGRSAASLAAPTAAAPPAPATTVAESRLASAVQQTPSQPGAEASRTRMRPATEVLADAAIAVPQPVAKAAPAGAAAPSPATANVAAVGDVAIATPPKERQKGETGAGAREATMAQSPVAGQPKKVMTVEVGNTIPAGGLESLWNEADFVVRARAVATRTAFLEQERAGQGLAAVGRLPTNFVVLEVFKRHKDIPPNDRFVVMPTGGEAADAPSIEQATDWVRIQTGLEYVLFLKRESTSAVPARLLVVGNSGGIYRLEGDRVVTGKSVGQELAPSRAELLARLRQLAGAAKR